MIDEALLDRIAWHVRSVCLGFVRSLHLLHNRGWKTNDIISFFVMALTKQYQVLKLSSVFIALIGVEAFTQFVRGLDVANFSNQLTIFVDYRACAILESALILR